MKAIISAVNTWAADRGLTAIRPVIYAMMEQESGYDPKAPNGIMQVIGNGRAQVKACYGFDLDKEGVNKIEPNIHAAIVYLHHLLCHQPQNNLVTAVVDYNGRGGGGGGGDPKYRQNVSKRLPNYTDDKTRLTAFRDDKPYPVTIEGCVGDFLAAKNVDEATVDKTQVKKGEVFKITWKGKNTTSVDIAQITVKFRRVRKGDESYDAGPLTIPKHQGKTDGVQAAELKYMFGADVHSGEHTFKVTARASSSKCGGARKSLTVKVAVLEQTKKVLIKRKDGVDQHYTVSDNNPKYAKEFGIPLKSGFVK